MRITLAYPYTDHQDNEHRPDDTVELPDGEARTLLQDGWARLPDETAASGTIATVLAEVGQDQAKAQVALDAEQAKARPRKSLVEALTDLTRAPDPADDGADQKEPS